MRRFRSFECRLVNGSVDPYDELFPATPADGRVDQEAERSRRRRAYCAVIPPSMTSPAPVMKAAASEARNTMLDGLIDEPSKHRVRGEI